MKKTTILIVALLGAVLIGCKDNTTKEPEVVTVDHTTDKDGEALKPYAIKEGNVTFKDADLSAVFDQYIQLQNALINTDGETAQQEAVKLQEVLTMLEYDQDGEVNEIVTAMAETSDVKLQREKFESLNDWMENEVADALESGVIYKQYCPMAFDDKGAYWLSTNKEILNPYFGDVMLHCGRVDSEIN